MMETHSIHAARSHDASLSLRIVAPVMAFFVCLLCACSRTPTASTQPASTPIVKSVERGPIRMSVSVPSHEVTVGEKLPLTIDVAAEPGVTVIMPAMKTALGKFEVSDPRTPPDIPDGTKRRWTHSYDLRTLESGEMEIPAFTLKFTDQRQAKPGDSAAVDSELTTEAFTVNVRSLMAGEFDPTSFRDIKGAVEITTPRHIWRWIAVAAAAIVLATAAVFLLFRWIRRRAKLRPPPPPVPAHVWALQQLDQLAAENLISRGEFHTFFFKLSLIARQYIERRFGIMAAEQTTDEFLRAAKSSPMLNDDQRSLLARFLRLADMVKFAKFQPQPGESEEVFAAARNFVHQTAARTPQPTPSPAEATA